MRDDKRESAVNFFVSINWYGRCYYNSNIIIMIKRHRSYDIEAEIQNGVLGFSAELFGCLAIWQPYFVGNCFDFLIVTISLVPINNVESVFVARLLRIIRVLRIITVVPAFRHIIDSLVKTIPRVGFIALLMFLGHILILQ